MRPGADQQIRVLARFAQCLVVLQLPIQEKIIPATHQISRCVHFSQARTEIDRLPVIIFWSMLHLFLVSPGCLPNDESVSLPKWQVSIGTLQCAVAFPDQ